MISNMWGIGLGWIWERLVHPGDNWEKYFNTSIGSNNSQDTTDEFFTQWSNEQMWPRL